MTVNDDDPTDDPTRARPESVQHALSTARAHLGITPAQNVADAITERAIRHFSRKRVPVPVVERAIETLRDEGVRDETMLVALHHAIRDRHWSIQQFERDARAYEEPF